jgi:hypothetical protein
MENTVFNRIRDHIGIRNGRLLQVFYAPQDGSESTIYMYQANGGIFTVLVSDDGSVEVMAPVSRSLSIDTTLAKLDEYIAGTI